MMRKIKFTIPFMSILFCLIFVISCGKAKTVEYNAIEKGTDKKGVIDILGGKANKVKEENGMETYVYTDSVYYDYHGTMTYYFADDKLAFSKWEYSDENHDTLEKVAEELLEKLEKNYGEGQKTNDTTGIIESWSINDSQSINFVYNHTDDLGYKITITNVD